MFEAVVNATVTASPLLHEEPDPRSLPWDRVFCDRFFGDRVPGRFPSGAQSLYCSSMNKED